MLQLLIKIPEKQTHDEVIEVIKDIDGQITDNICYGTRVVNKYKIINMVSTNKSITVQDITNFITQKELDWTVMAANNGKTINKDDNTTVTNTLLKYSKNSLLPFITPNRVINEVGITTITDKTSIDPINLGRFQGGELFDEEAGL